MKLFTKSFYQSSDLFDKICERFQLQRDNFAGEFSDACTSVSYGDASHTLISAQTFGEILEGTSYNFSLEDINEIRSWIPEDVMIDLES